MTTSRGSDEEQHFTTDVPADTVRTPTSMLMKVSFDGRRFTGWSCSNEKEGNDIMANRSNNDLSMIPATNQNQEPPRRRRRRRRSASYDPAQPTKGFVRPAEGAIRISLARLFGNVDPRRIVIESCSRTDKGVHAQSMVVQAYCLTEEAAALGRTANSEDRFLCPIPGKPLPHPVSTYDENGFVPFPKQPSQLMFALNRMLPHDIKIRGVAPTPTKTQRSARRAPKQQKQHKQLPNHIPFHPSLDSVNKTYHYTFSVGKMYDPTQWRRCWHVEFIKDDMDLEAIHEACRVLRGTHDFRAFCGQQRGGGSEEKRRQEQRSTLCTLTRVECEEIPSPSWDDSNSSIDLFPELDPPLRTFQISVTGDRFLYKMVRFLVGALIAVGSGKLSLGELQNALEPQSNRPKWDRQILCAPPHGLTLSHVGYDTPLEWIKG